MIRTQISLTKNEYHLAKKESSKLGISLAAYFRRALKAILPVQCKSEKPWMKYAGMISSGDPLSSQRIDEVVYGEKK